MAVSPNSWGSAKVISIAQGNPVYHMLILASDNTAHAWGRNDGYHLGDGTTQQRNTPVNVKENNFEFSNFQIQKIVGTGIGGLVYSGKI